MPDFAAATALGAWRGRLHTPCPGRDRLRPLAKILIAEASIAVGAVIAAFLVRPPLTSIAVA